MQEQMPSSPPETLRDHQSGYTTTTQANRHTKASSPTDSHNNCKNTVLHPFDHQVSDHSFITLQSHYQLDGQVGGHTQLMLLDKSTLCKPLVQRELSFYLNIPHELKGFVPKYKGLSQLLSFNSLFF